MQKQKISITVKCPICKERIPIEAEMDVDKLIGGIFSLPVIHGNHGFLLYIDRNGSIRGYQIFPTVVKKGEEQEIADILTLIKSVDTYHLATIITATLLDMKIPVMSDAVRKILEFLELSPDGGKILDLDNPPAYVKSPAKFFSQIIEEVKRKNNPELITMLKRIIDRIKDLFANIEKILNESDKVVLFSKLKEELRMKNDIDVVFAISFIERHGLSDKVIFTLI